LRNAEEGAKGKPLTSKPLTLACQGQAGWGIYFNCFSALLKLRINIVSGVDAKQRSFLI